MNNVDLQIDGVGGLSAPLPIVVLLTQGFTTFRAVFFATLLAVALSFLDRETALVPRRLARALASGGRSVLSVDGWLSTGRAAVRVRARGGRRERAGALLLRGA